ncbi:MAG: right-handed parallel beta-helix repeat-containing protein [Desulfuromonadales bacterium]|nr:right-handed parallel beta-helix repeat-containing protein [Desulfuromonadales bacterium]
MLKAKLVVLTALVFLAATFAPNAVLAAATVSGAINSDTVWTVAAGPYYVSSSVTIAGGVTLTIEPGTVIKFAQGQGLFVNGSLSAIGTSGSPINFTDYRDDSAGGDTNGDTTVTTPAPGWWRGIEIGNGGAANLTYCVVRYAGSSAPGYANVYKTGSGTGALTLSHSTISDSANYGVYLNGAATSSTISNNIITNNPQYGIIADGNSPASITGNTINSNGKYGIYASVSTPSTFSVNNNSFSGNVSAPIGVSAASSGIALGTGNTYTGPRHTLVEAGTIPNNQTWGATGAGLVYYVAGSVTVASNAVTLTVRPQTVVKFAQGAALFVDGNLDAVGTLGNEITFTDFRDDTIGGDSNGNGSATSPAPGWWRGIELNNYATATMDYCVVRFGSSSAGQQANLFKTGEGSVSISNSTFSNGAYRGISLVNTSGTISITSSKITNNAAYGMFLSGPGTAPIITKSQISGSNIGIYAEASANPTIGGSPGNGNDIFNNIAYSVQNNSSSPPTINATYNWWGNGSGPVLAGINMVSSFVTTTNFLSTPVFAGNTPFVPVPPKNILPGQTIGSANWTLSGSPYYVSGDITVNGTLTIDPGVVVKFAQNVGLWINGTLNAPGTSGNEIYFTDYRDDSIGGDTNGDGSATVAAPGWWRGINVLSGATATLNNCVVRYAGANNPYQSNVYKTGSGNLTISNSTISDSAFYGVYLNGAAGLNSFTGSIFSSNGYDGILAQGDSPATISGNTYVGNGRYGIYAGVTNPGTFSVSGTNTFDNNSSAPIGVTAASSGITVAAGNTFIGTRYILVEDGTISSSQTWGNGHPNYYLAGNVTVAAGPTLTIYPGTVVKFASNYGLWINGILDASGTVLNKIYFTDFRDDASGGDTNGDGSATAPAPGWWRGINVLNGASATLGNCVVSYAGYNNPYQSNVYKTGSGNLTISNSTISFSAFYGVYLNGASGVNSFSGSMFSSNGYDGILASGNSPFSVSGSTFSVNSRYGIYTDAIATAAVSISSSTFTANGAVPIEMTAVGSGAVVSDNNTFTGPLVVEGGDIGNSITWGNNRVYYVKGVITVPVGSTLTVPAGRIVKFAQNTHYAIYGHLQAVGTSGNRIIFTDFRDDAAGGDSNGDGTGSAPTPNWWYGILIYDGGSSTIDYATVRYAGLGSYGNIWKTGSGNLSLSNTILEQSSTFGLKILNSSGNHSISTNIVRDNGSHGILIQTGGTVALNNNAVSSSGVGNGGVHGIYLENTPAAANGNTVSSSGGYGLYITGATLPASVTLNTLNGNGIGGVGMSADSSGAVINDNNIFVGPIHVEPGSLTRNTTWINNRVYYSRGVITVNSGSTLTVPAGRIVKFAQNTHYAIYGHLQAVGTSGNRIIFTDFRDDAAGGDSNGDGTGSAPTPNWWYGILIYDGGSSTIDYATVRYAGLGSYGNIWKTGSGNLSLSNTILEQSSTFGLKILNSSGNHSISTNIVRDNGSHGILIQTGGTVALNNNAVSSSGVGNGGVHGIYLENTPAAANGNTVSSSGGYGLYITGATLPASVTLNTLNGNGIGGVGMSADSSGAVINDNNIFVGPIHVEPGSLTRNTTWINNRVYYSRGVITVNSGSTLTVPAGRIVKFAQNTHYAIYGHLQAVGASDNRIIFTDYRDDAAGGDSNGDGTGSAPTPNWWYGILIYDGGSSTIDYATVRYAGYQSYGSIWKTGSGNLSLSNSIIEQSSTFGLRIQNSSGTHSISTNTVRDNGSHGILIQSGGTVALNNNTISGSGVGNGNVHGIYLENTPAAVSGNTVSSSGGYGLYITGATLPASVTLNTLNGNGIGGVGMVADSSGVVIADNNVFDGPLHVEGGSITRNTDWVNNRVYYARGVITVNSGSTLTIPAGRVVKFAQNTYYAIYGHLQAVGASDNRIIFTDYRDDAAGGDSNGDGTGSAPTPNWWYGILIYDGGSSTIDYATVRYAGYQSYGSIWKTGSGNISVSNTILEKSSSFGLRFNGSSGNHTISNNTVRDNGSHGIYIQSSSGAVTVSNTTSSTNGAYGIAMENCTSGVSIGSSIFENNVQGGIYSAASSPLIQGNTIRYHTNYGMYLTGASTAPNVFRNSIFANGVGVYTTDSSNPLIGGSAPNGNNIFNNANYGVQNVSSSLTINATYNWWGAATGPRHSSNPLGTGDRVSDYVDFAHFLSGPAVPISIELVSPPLKAFGHVTTNTTSLPQVFTITNTGDQNLAFTSVTLTGTNANQFRITQNLCDGQSLATAASCTITTVFEPTVSKPAQAYLTVVTNDIYTPTLSIPLTGTGSIVLPFRDDFSGSMSPNWFVVNEELGNYSLTDHSGYLRIKTTPTNFWGNTNNAKDLFFVALPSGVNQFVATAKLLFPDTLSLSPNQNFQQGGVTFMSDKNGAPDLDNYVRAQYAFDSGRRFETAYDINGAPGEYKGGTIDSITSTTPVWIRIIRKTTEYTAEYSLDGSNYTLITSMIGPWDISFVGLHALNGDQSPALSIPVDVDYFEVYELPSISVTPTSGNFSSVSVGQSSPPTPFVIGNAGSGPLTITSIARNGSDPDMFTVNNGTCGSLPAIIAPNSTCTFSVTFTPTTDGLKTANIPVSSNDIETPVTNLQLSGTTSYILSLTLDGTGNGSVNSNANFSCTTSEKNCSGRFDYGTIVYLYAVSEINSKFTGWTGDCSGANCSVTMKTNKSVTGTFDIRTFTITATAGAHGGISSPGVTTYTYGSSASFTVTPDAGYHITSVLIDGVSSYVANSQAANIYTFNTIITNHTIAVTFAADTTPQIRIKRDLTGYQTVQDAYNNAGSGDVIQLVNVTHVGPAFFALRDIDITLKGGYELIADENGGYTFSETGVGNAALQGPVTLDAGSVVMDTVTVR